MKKLYILLFTILISSLSFGQIVINEVDADTPGTDVAEFIELLWTPNTALDGYVVVLFNGSDDLSYLSFDLDGYSTDANGFFILANTPLVVAGDLDVGNSNIIQNGADAVAVYLDDASNWPNDTAISTTNLIDVFIYDTNDSDDTGLLTGFGVSTQYNEDENGFKDTQSLQRQSDGTYLAFDPTLRAENTAPSPNPTLTLLDSDPSGSTVTVGPEDLSGDLEFAVTNFVVGEPGTGTQGDGYISWQISNVTDGGLHDGGDIFDTSTPTPFATLLPDKEYFLSAVLKDNNGDVLTNPEAGYNLQAFTLGYIDVASIADLRAVTDDGYYRLTNEAFLTFQQSFRGQKFIQDATGGILIDDNDGFISTTYAINDGITNIRGQVSEFGGMKQFVPSTDYGAPTSTGNTITPQTVTLAELTSNAELYESELVEVIAVTLDNSTFPTFNNGDVYAMSQSTDNFDFRATFFDVDYIGTNVPTVSTDIVGIINERSGNAYYLSARDTNDISALTLSNDTFKENNFKIYPNPTSLGYVTLSSKNSAKMNVSVFDILGKQVLNETVSNNILNVSSLTSGVYIMNISQDDARITKKLVIQ
jgi:hypothetical protein